MFCVVVSCTCDEARRGRIWCVWAAQMLHVVQASNTKQHCYDVYYYEVLL